jgi:hypothetical protein
MRTDHLKTLEIQKTTCSKTWHHSKDDFDREVYTNISKITYSDNFPFMANDIFNEIYKALKNE